MPVPNFIVENATLINNSFSLNAIFLFVELMLVRIYNVYKYTVIYIGLC